MGNKQSELMLHLVYVFLLGIYVVVMTNDIYAIKSKSFCIFNLLDNKHLFAELTIPQPPVTIVFFLPPSTFPH